MSPGVRWWLGCRASSQPLCPALLSLLTLLVSSPHCPKSLGHWSRDHPWSNLGQVKAPFQELQSPHLGDTHLNPLTYRVLGPWACHLGKEHIGPSAASCVLRPRTFALVIPSARMPSIQPSLAAPFKSLPRCHFLSEATLTILRETADPTPQSFTLLCFANRSIDVVRHN